MNRTPSRRHSSASAFVTSCARSLCGKTRFPRSTLVGTPSDSKNSTVSAGENRDIAPVRKRGFVGTLARNSSRGQSFVRLQRPFPVISSFLPHSELRSNSAVFLPPRAHCTAAKSPAAPPPTIITSNAFVINFVFRPDALQNAEPRADTRRIAPPYFQDQRVY